MMTHLYEKYLITIKIEKRDICHKGKATPMLTCILYKTRVMC